jgi:hypothetical protein
MYITLYIKTHNTQTHGCINLKVVYNIGDRFKMHHLYKLSIAVATSREL